MSDRSWWAALTGATDRELLALLRRQHELAHASAEVVAGLVGGRLSLDDARVQAVDLEQRGDTTRGEVVELLAQLLTTPLDREDLYRLSRSLEDVTDNLRDYAREADLLGIGADELLAPVVDSILISLQRLQRPIEALDGDLEDTRTHALEAQRDINAVRRAYQQSLAALYDQPLHIDTLKRRDLLRRLDVVGLRLGEAVAALSDGAMKRGR